MAELRSAVDQYVAEYRAFKLHTAEHRDFLQELARLIGLLAQTHAKLDQPIQDQLLHKLAKLGRGGMEAPVDLAWRTLLASETHIRAEIVRMLKAMPLRKVGRPKNTCANDLAKRAALIWKNYTRAWPKITRTSDGGVLPPLYDALLKFIEAAAPDESFATNFTLTQFKRGVRELRASANAAASKR